MPISVLAQERGGALPSAGASCASAGKDLPEIQPSSRRATEPLSLGGTRAGLCPTGSPGAWWQRPVEPVEPSGSTFWFELPRSGAAKTPTVA